MYILFTKDTHSFMKMGKRREKINFNVSLILLPTTFNMTMDLLQVI